MLRLLLLAPSNKVFGKCPRFSLALAKWSVLGERATGLKAGLDDVRE